MWRYLSAFLIQHFDDRVLYIGCSLLAVGILLLAWMSTYVRNEFHITYHVFHLVHSPPTSSTATQITEDEVRSALATGSTHGETANIPTGATTSERNYTDYHEAPFEFERQFTLAVTEESATEPMTVTGISITDDEEDVESDIADESELVPDEGHYSLSVAEELTSVVSSATPSVQAAPSSEATDHTSGQQDIQGNIQDDESTSETSTRPEGSIMVRLKYLDDQQKVVFASPNDTISLFKRTHFRQELSDNKIVRLIFCGRELKEHANARLMEYGVNEDATIHCLITQGAASAIPTALGSPTLASDETGPLGLRSMSMSTGGVVSEVDLGVFMFPSFGLVLSAIWYSRVVYREYFNVLSTFALVGISLLYLVTLFTFWTTRSSPPPSLASRSPTNNNNNTNNSSPSPRVSRVHIRETTTPSFNHPFTVREVHYRIPSRPLRRREQPLRTSTDGEASGVSSPQSAVTVSSTA